ncbi:MAG: MaoC family dehydratase N-terminal domain-containing protein [Actinomycetes bacterium]
MADTSVIGKPLAPSVTVMERGPVSNFAKAVKDENPIYQDLRAAKAAGFDSIPVPPTMGFAFANWGQFPELQPENTTGGSNPVMEVIGSLMKTGGMILHGEQEFTYHGPILVGDTLTSTGRISNHYEKTSSNGKKMTFISSENEYRNQRGELVLTAVMTLIHRAS